MVQLAYGAENGVWRNFFLSGATELREGNFGTPVQATSPTLLAQLTPEQTFDMLAINVNGPRAWDLDLAIDVSLADSASNYRLTLRNGVLVHRKVAADERTADATLRLDTKIRLIQLMSGDLASPGFEVIGDSGALPALLGTLDRPNPAFDIVTP
jgi:alkyl sulfatase BDS1-like metallo-beta-lactamase superfamily hydrolase